MRLFLIYVALNLADVGLTVIGLERPEFYERNVLVRQAIDTYGYCAMFWLAGVCTWIVGYLMRYVRKVVYIPIVAHAVTVTAWVYYLTIWKG